MLVPLTDPKLSRSPLRVVWPVVLVVAGMALTGCGDTSGTPAVVRDEPVESLGDVAVANLVEAPVPLTAIQTAFEEEETIDVPLQPHAPVVVHVAPPNEGPASSPPAATSHAAKRSVASPVSRSEDRHAFRITLTPDGPAKVVPKHSASSVSGPLLKLHTAATPPATDPPSTKAPASTVEVTNQPLGNKAAEEAVGEHSVLVQRSSPVSKATDPKGDETPVAETTAGPLVAAAAPVLKVATAPTRPEPIHGRLKLTTEPASPSVALAGKSKTALAPTEPARAGSVPERSAAGFQHEPSPTVASAAPQVKAAVPLMPKTAVADTRNRASEPVNEPVATPSNAIAVRAAVPPSGTAEAPLAPPRQAAPNLSIAPEAPRQIAPPRVVASAPTVSPKPLADSVSVKPVVESPLVRPSTVAVPASPKPQPVAVNASAEPKDVLSPKNPVAAAPLQAAEPVFMARSGAESKVRTPQPPTSELRVSTVQAPPQQDWAPAAPP